MHQNYAAMAAILPEVQSAFPEAKTHDWSQSPEDRYIEYRTDELDLIVSWDETTGYEFGVYLKDTKGNDLFDDGLQSVQFQNPTEFKNQLGTLITTTASGIMSRFENIIGRITD